MFSTRSRSTSATSAAISASAFSVASLAAAAAAAAAVSMRSCSSALRSAAASSAASRSSAARCASPMALPRVSKSPAFSSQMLLFLCGGFGGGSSSSAESRFENIWATDVSAGRAVSLVLIAVHSLSSEVSGTPSERRSSRLRLSRSVGLSMPHSWKTGIHSSQPSASSQLRKYAEARNIGSAARRRRRRRAPARIYSHEHQRAM